MRRIIQTLSAFIMNPWLSGFANGRIYTGNSKQFCVPGMNCYSCPSAVGACPIGAMQSVSGSHKFQYSLYVSGFIIMLGGLFGRLICGWLCPFGFLQDLLFKLSKFKKKLPLWTRHLKIISVALVLVGPLIITNRIGMGDPVFCKWICPVGTIEGGIPLAVMQPALRSQLGLLFGWKLSIAALIIGLAIIVSRPFCKNLCPLGWMLGIFNKVSVVNLELKKDKCVTCGVCANTCPMDIDPVHALKSIECIRCMRCKKSCPTKAIQIRVMK